MGWDEYARHGHHHEPYEIYGTAATQHEVSELRSLVAELREDLAAAEERIRQLEISAIVRVRWT